MKAFSQIPRVFRGQTTVQLTGSVDQTSDEASAVDVAITRGSYSSVSQTNAANSRRN